MKLTLFVLAAAAAPACAAAAQESGRTQLLLSFGTGEAVSTASQTFDTPDACRRAAPSLLAAHMARVSDRAAATCTGPDGGLSYSLTCRLPAGARPADAPALKRQIETSAVCTDGTAPGTGDAPTPGR